MTLSRKGAKSRTRARKLRSTGTKARTRVGRIREPRAELEKKLAEALEQQAATSEVLRVISSSPGELAPVFQAMLENAIKICEANFGNLFTYSDNSFRVVAQHNAPPAYREFWEREPIVLLGDEPLVPLARLATSKSVVHMADLATEQGYIERHPRVVALVEGARARTMLLCRCSKRTS